MSRRSERYIFRTRRRGPSAARIVATLALMVAGALAALWAVTSVAANLATPAPSETAAQTSAAQVTRVAAATAAKEVSKAASADAAAAPLRIPKPKPKTSGTKPKTPEPPKKTLPAASATKKAPTAAVTSAQTAPKKPTGKPFVVVIDAGHQGQGDNRQEPIGPGASQTKPAVADGTSGVTTHLRESIVNLRVALKLRDALAARGFKIVMIRTSENVDIANSQRAKIADQAHADLFIRLHCDGVTSPQVVGLLTLVPARNQWTGPIVVRSARAGSDIQKATLAVTGQHDRGVAPRGDMSGFNWSTVPSVIVEMGVMTNRAEDRKLATASFEHELAQGITDGVVAYRAGK